MGLVLQVPKAPLKRHLDGTNKYAKEDMKRLGRNQVLPSEVEEEQLQYVIAMENMFFGVTRKELMTLAFQIAEIKGTSHTFKMEKKQAGKDWYRSFMKRNPQISLRQPESTSMARATGFNREAIDRYFSLLETIIDENNLDAGQIFNMDESGISTVQKTCQKVLGRKGKHQIGSLASGERGMNTTVVCCASAAGNYVPPIILFKRKRMPPQLSEGAPLGLLVTCNDSGWMDTEVFISWLEHFINHVKPSQERKVLIVLDGHQSHTKNLRPSILPARMASFFCLCHLTPRIRHNPWTELFFKPMQTYYNQAIEKWLRSHPGRCVTPFQICQLFKEAYIKAATTPVVINGFASCGIWPCSRDVFDSSEFEPSFAESAELPVPLSGPCCSSAVPSRPYHPSTEQRNLPSPSAEQHDPSSSSAEQHDPPSSSAEQHGTPCSSAEQRDPPCSSAEQHDTPCSSAEQHGTPSSSAEQRDPPYSSAERRDTSCSSAEQHGTPSSLAEQRDPPCSSAEQRDPPSSSADQYDLPNSSAEWCDPPILSTENVYPHSLSAEWCEPLFSSAELCEPLFTSADRSGLSCSLAESAQSSQPQISPQRSSAGSFSFQGVSSPNVPMTVDLQTEVQSESLSVVNITQDGRCFFRCAAASSDPMERTTKRVNGHTAEPDLKLRERVASDSLRSRL